MEFVVAFRGSTYQGKVNLKEFVSSVFFNMFASNFLLFTGVFLLFTQVFNFTLVSLVFALSIYWTIFIFVIFVPTLFSLRK